MKFKVISIFSIAICMSTACTREDIILNNYTQNEIPVLINQKAFNQEQKSNIISSYKKHHLNSDDNDSVGEILLLDCLWDAWVAYADIMIQCDSSSLTYLGYSSCKEMATDMALRKFDQCIGSASNLTPNEFLELLGMFDNVINDNQES